MEKNPVHEPSADTRIPDESDFAQVPTHDLQARVTALLERLLRAEERLAERDYEVQYLKGHSSYRLASRLRNTLAWNILRWLKSGNRDVVMVRALGEQCEGAKGCEVWLLAARPAPGKPAVPWYAMELVDARRWRRERQPNAPYGEVLRTARGKLRLPLYGEDPVLTFLKHPWSGKVEVAYNRQRCVVDLHADEATELEIHLRDIAAYGAQLQGPLRWKTLRRGLRTAPGDGRCVRTAPGARQAGDRYTEQECQWVEETRRKQVSVLAVHTPRWVGVSASTRTLFEHRYEFPASPDVEPNNVGPAEARRQAGLIAASGVKHVICSGGDEIHYWLVKELKRRDKDIRCDLLWHGSHVQFVEDYTWRIFRLWVEAAREGVIHTVGTVKKGMEVFFERLGCHSKFLMNYVPEVPVGPSFPDPGGPHLGLWLSGHAHWKLPYPMLAAAKLIPGSTIRGSNLPARASEVIDFLGLPGDAWVRAVLPLKQLRDAMRKTHVSLYVTFSECCPMVPLESLSVGVPCLTGPTSHLFEDNEYLHDRLVVPYPDRADVIARHIRGTVEERDRIIDEYIRYAPGYNARARESVAEFLRG